MSWGRLPRNPMPDCAVTWQCVAEEALPLPFQVRHSAKPNIRRKFRCRCSTPGCPPHCPCTLHAASVARQHSPAAARPSLSWRATWPACIALGSFWQSTVNHWHQLAPSAHAPVWHRQLRCRSPQRGCPAAGWGHLPPCSVPADGPKLCECFLLYIVAHQSGIHCRNDGCGCAARAAHARQLPWGHTLAEGLAPLPAGGARGRWEK